ncbi:MAG: hypothetical protein Q8L34_01665 [Candidatus Woesearchaeota archaeon]|nr:hypothetical protein [Candidatus Woesearchaeota archaeon]
MAVNNIQFTKIEVQIAKYLFKHYKERYNARQLARILNINHAHANGLCNILADKKLLTKEEIGNSAFFSYQYNNKLAIKFMEYMLSLEDKEFPTWLSVLSHSLKKFKDSIKMGLVFGSSIKVRNFNDIDVLLMYSTEKSKDIKKIKGEIRKSELVEKPIRYVDIAEKDILLNKKDKIFYNILSESLVFHNPEKYVEVVRKCHK